MTRQPLLVHGTTHPIDAGDPSDHVDRFATIAPEAIAATDGVTSFNYRELASASAFVASRLREVDVELGDCVAVCMHRRPMLLAALLGVLRAGAHFLPLDPSHPARRRAMLIADAAPAVLIVDRDVDADVAGTRAVVWRLEEDRLASTGRESPRTEAITDAAAYLIYTSGSTGKPKGVMVGRAALMNYLAWAVETYDLRSGCGSLVHTSIAVDLTITSLFAPLLTGNRVTFCPSDDIEDLARALTQGGSLSFLKLTPTKLLLLTQLVPGDEWRRTVRHLVVGGEQLSSAHLRPLGPGANGLPITNEYGPTETTVGSTAFTFLYGTPVPDPVPIGTPIWNTVVELRPIPDHPETAGEIVIGGAGVAIGYRDSGSDASDRFIVTRDGDGDGDGSPRRWYRTGDVGVLGSDGVLVYQGRMDTQLKIHGYRVDTAEVEAVLARAPGVAAVVVVPTSRVGATGPLLAAAVVATPRVGAAGSLLAVAEVPVAAPDSSMATATLVDRLRAWSEAELPVYMRPDHIGIVDRIPMLPSGKVDRGLLASQLAAPSPAAVTASTSTPVATVVGVVPGAHDVLAAAWQQVLGHRPERGSNFFAAGGDSIKALNFVLAARKLGLHLTLGDVLHGRTLDRFAALAKPAASARKRLRSGTALPLNANQRGYFALNVANPNPWCLRWVAAVPAAFDPDRITDAFRVVLHKHPSLLCRFEDDGLWSASIHADRAAVPAFHEIDAEPSSVYADIHERLADLEAGIDITSGPVVRLCLVRNTRLAQTYIGWVAHHLVADVISLQIMTADLIDAYQHGTRTPDELSDDGYYDLARSELHRADVPFRGTGGAPRLELRASSPAGQALLASHRERGGPQTTLAAALLRALARVCPSEQAICIEHNGRTGGPRRSNRSSPDRSSSHLSNRDLSSSDLSSPDLSSTDLSGTVGWLTAFHVCEVADAHAHEADQLRDAIDAQLQRLAPPSSETLPGVALNYFGDQDGGGSQGVVPFVDPSAGQPGPGPLFPLEWVCWRAAGRLHSSWRYAAGLFDRSTIERLSREVSNELIELEASTGRAGPLVSSWRGAPASRADLDRIAEEFK